MYYYTKKTRETLSWEQQLQLIREAQAGNVQSRNKLVEYHLPLMIKKAHRNHKCLLAPLLDADDLIGACVLGAIRAIDKFDPSKNVKLTTYMDWWFRAEMRGAVDDAQLCRVPHTTLMRCKKGQASAETMRLVRLHRPMLLAAVMPDYRYEPDLDVESELSALEAGGGA